MLRSPDVEHAARSAAAMATAQKLASFRRERVGIGISELSPEVSEYLVKMALASADARVAYGLVHMHRNCLERY
jgi:hypothetical protein